jgi:DNA-binding IclR family transcriptional regulator
VNSCEKLHVLVLVASCERRVAEVARELDLPAQVVEGALGELEACAIVRRVGEASWEYAPGLEARGAVDELVALYVRDPAEVLRELASRSVERVRHAAAQLLVQPRRGKDEPP